jgi:CYTH domain-containing protein
MSEAAVMEAQPRRLFLVDVDKFTDFLATEGDLGVCEIRQYYLIFGSGRATRMREVHYGHKDSTYVRSGATPLELDGVEFKADDEEYMEKKHLKTGNEVKRIRYEVEFDDQEWVVDLFDFQDQHDGDDEYEMTLALATFGDRVSSTESLPPWLLTDVTDDSRYRTANIALHGWPE